MKIKGTIKTGDEQRVYTVDIEVNLKQEIADLVTCLSKMLPKAFEQDFYDLIGASRW